MVEQLRWAQLIQLWRVYQLLRDRPDLLAMFRRERNETTLSGILFLFFLLLGSAPASCTGWKRDNPAARSDSLRCLLVDAGDPLYRGIRGSGAQDGGGALRRQPADPLWVGLFGALSGFMASLFVHPGKTNDDTAVWRRQQSEQQAQLLKELKALARRGAGAETEVGATSGMVAS